MQRGGRPSYLCDVHVHVLGRERGGGLGERISIGGIDMVCSCSYVHQLLQ